MASVFEVPAMKAIDIISPKMKKNEKVFPRTDRGYSLRSMQKR